MQEIQWDSQLYNDQHRFVSNYGADVLQWLAPKAGEKILDVGCGTGDLAAKIQEVGAIVVGVDSSAEMISHATAEYPNVQFKQQSAAQLDYDAAFDAVFSNATFHWVKDQEKMLSGIFKALKPNGRLVAEFGGKGNIKAIVDAIDTAAAQLELSHRVISNFWFFPSINQYAALLEAAGFETEQMWLFDRPTPLVGDDGMLKWINQFAQHAFVNLTKEEADHITATAIEILRPDYFRDGIWIADYKRLRIKAWKRA